MPGPTTEVLNDDLKGLRDDFHKLALEIREANHQIALKAAQDTHKVELDVREVSTQVKGLLGAIRLLTVLTITSIAGSIWWGATLTADLKHVEIRADERFKAVDARFDRVDSSLKGLETRTDERFKAVDARFDRVESSLKNLETKTDERFKAVDARFDRVDSSLKNLETRTAERSDRLASILEKLVEQTKPKP